MKAQPKALLFNINDIIPAESDPKYGFVSNPEIIDRDGDEYPELMVKFDRSDVQNIVAIGNVTLIVTGEIEGMLFEGSDTIRVIGEDVEHPRKGRGRPDTPPGQGGTAPGKGGGQGHGSGQGRGGGSGQDGGHGKGRGHSKR